MFCQASSRSIHSFTYRQAKFSFSIYDPMASKVASHVDVLGALSVISSHEHLQGFIQSKWTIHQISKIRIDNLVQTLRQ